MPTINIMMFGGRRCGKTTIIAAMKECFERVVAEGGTNLKIEVSDEDFAKTLNPKIQLIKKYFAIKNFAPFTIEDEPSHDTLTFVLDIKFRDKNDREPIELHLTDFPGEWLDYNKGTPAEYKTHINTLNEILSTCHIILVAIDTPYLMEEKGAYNEERNYCALLKDMVQKHFLREIDDLPKMIMFVPIKCEKYYNAKEMDKVNARVQAAYKDLLDADYSKRNYIFPITPILTIGPDSIEFANFQLDKEGNYITTSQEGVEMGYPFRPVFRRRNLTVDYSPLFCEQPLLYILCYFAKYLGYITSRQNERNFITRIRAFFGQHILNWASAEDFFTESKFIHHHLKTNGDGYCILPLNPPMDL